jgi:hypothetical protein
VAGDVRLCVVSMSARAPDGGDAAYLEWHALDHLPEQFRIPGVVHGQRWVSTPACRAARPARAATGARFDATEHVVQYLFADPVAASLDRFFALGAELRAAGRMPALLPSVELGGYEVVARAAAPRALVTAEVLPWRPGRGAYLLLDEPDGADGVDGVDGVDGLGDTGRLCDVEGVAGVWQYRGGVFHPRLADTSGLRLTVCYLDGDPVAAGRRIGQVVESLDRGVLFAAPFEAVVPWAWERHLP